MLDVVQDTVAVESLADAIEPRIGFDLDEMRRVFDHHRGGLDVGDLDLAELAFSSRHGFENLRFFGEKTSRGGCGGSGEKASSIEHVKTPSPALDHIRERMSNGAKGFAPVFFPWARPGHCSLGDFPPASVLQR